MKEAMMNLIQTGLGIASEILGGVCHEAKAQAIVDVISDALTNW